MYCVFLIFEKNLISGSLLSKNGFKLVFEDDKFMSTKMGYMWEKDSLVMVSSRFKDEKDRHSACSDMSKD